MSISSIVQAKEPLSQHFIGRSQDEGYPGFNILLVKGNNRQKDILDYYNKIKETAVSCYFIIPELKQFNIELSDPGLIKWDIEY